MQDGREGQVINQTKRTCFHTLQLVKVILKGKDYKLQSFKTGIRWGGEMYSI